MRIRDVERFFRELDRRVVFPVEVILTGGAAAILYGVSRVTLDIDFEVHIALRKGTRVPDAWGKLEHGLKEAARATGITPQYAEDIDRWSAIALPNKKSRLYRRIGKVEVRLLDPGLWAIGKLARFLPSDVSDLVTVLKSLKTSPRPLARLWGRALGMSPASSAQGAFRRQVELFFDQRARSIWGSWTNPDRLKALFLSSARSTHRLRR